MDSVSPEEGQTIPKQIKIVNKTHGVGSTDGLEPSVEAEDSAEMPCSTGQCGDRTGNKKQTFHNYLKS